jgi:HK97 family phage portal protein
MMWFDPIYRIMGEKVDSNDMLHIRRFTMPGEAQGLSPIKQAAIAIGMGLSAEEYGYRYFKESANPSGVLSTDQDLDEGSVRRQQKNWISSHGGRRMPAVLTNGFKWQTLSISPEESQFLATRQFQRSEICMMYGVPPILIGDTKETTAWGTGVEQITLGAVTYTFSAWTACIESEISACLPRGQFVRFDYDALLRGDTEGRFNAYKTAIQGTWMTPNEVRAREEMDPIDGGDVLLQPTNLSEFPYKAQSGPAAPVTPATDKPADEKPLNGSPLGNVPSKPISGGEKTPPRNGKPVASTVN